jgi:hypothetical protein
MNNTTKKQNTSHSYRPRNLDWALIVAIVTLIGSAIFFIGQLSAKLESANEKIETTNDNVEKLNDRLDNIILVIQNIKIDKQDENKEVTALGDDPNIYLNGKLGSGLDMGVNTSGGITNWVDASNGIIEMNYPKGQKYGSVYITVGKPTQPPRPGKNYSKFKKIIIEAKGKTGGETILVGLKDKNDPDDGSEAKVRLSLSKDWGIYELKLKESFSTADLTQLYVVTEFVFETQSKSVSVKRVLFVK